MLQALSDLFLLISHDKENITSKDLSNFYIFIMKKIPQIEQKYQYGFNNSRNDNFSKIKKKISLNLQVPKDNKKNAHLIQKQMIDLFNDLIDYCYSEKIVILSNKKENLIKLKIEEKLKNNYKFNNNNSYSKDDNAKKINKKEIRNFIIYLILNEEIKFNITPIKYINFFNSPKYKTNRQSIEPFIKYIQKIIKLYQEKKVPVQNNFKIKIHTKKPSSKLNLINNNNGKQNLEKNNSKIIQSFNTQSKLLDNYMRDLKGKRRLEKNDKGIGEKVVNTTNDINNESEINYIINNDMDEYIFYNQEDTSDKDDNNDTIRCETPKNINPEDKKGPKLLISLDKLENTKRHKCHSIDKNYNKINIKKDITYTNNDTNNNNKKYNNYLNLLKNVKIKDKGNNSSINKSYSSMVKSQSNTESNYNNNVGNQTEKKDDKTSENEEKIEDDNRCIII